MAEITSNPSGSPRVQDTTGTSQADSSKPAEFENFEKLAGKLTQVPKSEVDEKRKNA